MNSQARLQAAIAKAKAGHELSARNLFLDVVRVEPDNKLAWLWLVGLLDEPEALINACENLLRIDPTDTRVRLRLDQLFAAEQEHAKLEQTSHMLDEALRFFAKGKTEYGLMRVRDLVDLDDEHEKAWGLLAKFSRDLGEKVRAMKRLTELDPADEKKRAILKRWTYYQENPLALAAFYEEQGKPDMSIGVYERLAASAKDRRDWDRIVNEIERLEYLQRESIAHVSPLMSIARLTAGMPLLFFFLLLTHAGYKLSYFSLAMFLEFLVVLGGSFLMALAAVGAEHSLWRRLGNVAGRATKPLRMVVGTVGFFVMALPFLLLTFDAFQRWQTVFEDLMTLADF